MTNVIDAFAGRLFGAVPALQQDWEQYVESQRLYRQLPDGKREYLSDKELAETRARARQTVIDYCGS